MHNDDSNTDEQRRKIVKLAAGTAIILPLGGLAACSGGDSDEGVAAKAEKAAEAAAEKTEAAAAKVAETADDAMDSAAEMAGDAKDKMQEVADDAGEAVDAMAEKADGAMQDAKETAGDMVADAKGAMSDKAGGLPRVKEDDAVAQALGYKHDASKLDAAKYPGRGAEANEYCKNCSLYVAGNDGWGACSIFAGKAVNANGWCASYNRKSA